jgi:hypothetical protein
MSYLEKIKRAIAELADNAHVDLRSFRADLTDYPDEINDYDCKSIEDALGVAVSAELRAGMNASNGAAAWWFFETPDGKKDSGEFQLVALVEVFTYEQARLFGDDTSAEQKALLEKLRVIDQRPNTGDDKFAAFKVEQGRMPPEIWYYDRGDCFQMDLGYIDYLDALALTKGVADWQYLYCDVDPADPLRRGLRSKLERRLDALQSLFPSRDYAALRERATRLPF